MNEAEGGACNCATPLEDEIITEFDESSNKPVSAAFTASIPEGQNPNTSTTQPSSPREQWPVMEQMSVEAIDEMVDKIFTTVGADINQGLTFDNFRSFVDIDTTIMAWFDALGNVNVNNHRIYSLGTVF